MLYCTIAYKLLGLDRTIILAILMIIQACAIDEYRVIFTKSKKTRFKP